MYKSIAFFVLFLSLLAGENLYAQDLKTSVNDNKLLDSLRKKEEEGSDSVVFTSKFIRYTTLRLTKDSIQTVPLDTSLTGFHNFSVLAQPRTPTIGLGNLGLPAMPLLFEPVKTIGFDAGFHTLDFYKMTQDDVRYYQARAPFTSLYYVNAGEKEQVFRVIHTQNIKRNWNFGANFNRIGANGEYRRQRGDHLNGALFTWYQSPGKRYNLWASGVFNTLKAQENGSIVKDSIFLPGALDIARESEIVRLTNSRRLYRQNSIMLKQTYFVGRIDSVAQEITDKILPTNKISYTFKYNTNSFAFLKDETDNQEVIPPGKASLSFTNDSTSYKQIQNEFIYTFFLRSRGALKNELKIDAGIRHDFYNYSQQVLYKDQSPYYNYKSSFQNVSLLGFAGYRFSNRIDLNVDLQQIVQGRQIGDFLYEAKSNVLLSRSVGRVVLGAYFQNKSPEEVYERFFSNHLDWVNKFDRTKTVNFSFNYLNDKLKVDIGAQYFLIDNHHYFAAGGEEDPLLITPQQATAPINLFKVTLGKRFSYGKFRLDSYVVYQKTDNQNILRTPEVYTFNSFYIDQTLFKVLRANIGFDVRYNTPYKAYRYSVAAGQFYIGSEETFTAIPIVDVWFKASLRKANIFVKCDYINQGYPLNGYYTVDRYPMQDRALFKFGVSWNFYD
jgi:hypothetical protein